MLLLFTSTCVHVFYLLFLSDKSRGAQTRRIFHCFRNTSTSHPILCEDMASECRTKVALDAPHYGNSDLHLVQHTPSMSSRYHHRKRQTIYIYIMYNMILAPASCTLVHVSYSLILAYKYLFNRSKSTTTKTEPASTENYRILVFAAILKYLDSDECKFYHSTCNL